MSDEGPKKSSAAEDAIREALSSVERLEAEAVDGDGDDDELNPDDVEILTGPAANLDDDDEEIALLDEEPPRKPTVQDAILQSMIDAKNEALEVLDQTQKEAKSLRERLMRVSAEFENYKKRQTREKQDSIKFANEGLLKDLLPVLDNFGLAVQSATTADEADEQTLKTVVEGIGMVHKQFVETLKRSGVEPFTAVGSKFDPAKHEAISTREDSSVPSQTVLEEYQRGYMLQGRLVRPAMVIVSSGGPPAAAPGGKKADDDDS